MGGSRNSLDENLPLLSDSSFLEIGVGSSTSATLTPSPITMLNAKETETNSQGQHHSVSRGDFAWIMIAIILPVFLAACDATVVATLQTPIGSYFGRSYQADFLGTGYLLSAACFTPLYGRLSDILGRKGAMLLAVGLFGIGTILCTFATSMNLLIAARVIAGMGGGGINPVAYIIMMDIVPLRDRGLYLGISACMFSAGAALGGPIGGWISDHYGWRLAFGIRIPLTLISFVITLFKVNLPLPLSLQKTSLLGRLQTIDILGAITLIAALVCFLLPISFQSTFDLPWSDPRIWGMLLTSVVAWVMLVVVELKWTKFPFLPMRFFRKRMTLTVSLTSFFSIYVYHALLFNVPLYFTVVRGATVEDAGNHLLPSAIAVAAASIAVGWMMRRTGRYWWLTVFSAFLGVYSCLLISHWDDNTPDFELWYDIVPNGWSCSAIHVIIYIPLAASVRQDDVAAVAGFAYLFRGIGQVMGVSLSGSLVQEILGRELRKRITGLGSEEIIRSIKSSTEIIRTLDPPIRQAAIDSFKVALKTLFAVQTVLSVITVLTSAAIEEISLE